MSISYAFCDATVPFMYMEHPLVKSFLSAAGEKLKLTYVCSPFKNWEYDIVFTVRTEDVHGGDCSMNCYDYRAKTRAQRILQTLIKRNMLSIKFNSWFDSGGGDDYYETNHGDFMEHLESVPSLVLREVLAMRHGE